MEWRRDGFDIARELDNRGYNPDAQLVEILDSASSILHRIHQNVCEDWVRVYRPPAPQIGTRVRWPRRMSRGTGIVTENRKDGRSIVAFASEGHLRSKREQEAQLRRTGSVSLGLIVEWEELQIVELALPL